MSDSLRPYGLQHARLPCSSPTSWFAQTIESVMPSNHLILCCPLLLFPSIFPSIRVFSNESVLCIWWPMYWSFSFSISPSDEYSGLTSFRIGWFDLLTVRVTYTVCPLLLGQSHDSGGFRLTETMLQEPRDHLSP